MRLSPIRRLLPVAAVTFAGLSLAACTYEREVTSRQPQQPVVVQQPAQQAPTVLTPAPTVTVR